MRGTLKDFCVVPVYVWEGKIVGNISEVLIFVQCNGPCEVGGKRVCVIMLGSKLNIPVLHATLGVMGVITGEGALLTFSYVVPVCCKDHNKLLAVACPRYCSSIKEDKSLRFLQDQRLFQKPTGILMRFLPYLILM